jgi:branched-chain amino acid aminotransferase
LLPAHLIWLQGEFVDWDEARVHVLTHALNHGTGVFEGLRSYTTPDGPAIFRLGDHLARLERSAQAILLPLTAEYDLATAAKDVVMKNGLDDCYIRISAFRGYGEMFINPDNSPVCLYVAAWRHEAPSRAGVSEPAIRATISSWRRQGPNGIPAQVKVTGTYVTLAAARAEAVRNGYDEAIMLAPNGNVAEAAIANLFAVRDSTITTPPLADGPLPGITRDTVMTLLRELGMHCEERSLGPADLYDADEIFLTGSGVEIIGVCEVDGRLLRGSGDVTRTVRAAYEETVRGRNARHVGWLDLCALR